MKYELTDETRTSTRWIGAITGPRSMSELLTDEALEYVVTGVLKLPDQEALTPPRAALLGVTLLAAYWSRHEAGDE